jgi:hypothetical protein
MSAYGWTNEDGEPIMDGAAYRFEQQLDSEYQPDPDDFYYNEPEPRDPEDCDHPDTTGNNRGVQVCDWCGSEVSFD